MGEGKWDMGRRSGPDLLTMVGLCGFLERWRKGCYSLPHRVVFGGEEELESIKPTKDVQPKPNFLDVISSSHTTGYCLSTEVVRCLWDFLQDYVLPPLPLVHT